MNLDSGISWSTHGVEPHKRIPAWRDFLITTFEECDLDYVASSEFWTSMTSATFGDIGVGRIRGSDRRALRAPERAKHAKDGVVFSFAATGSFSFEQAGREIVFSAGEGAFFHNCLAGKFAAKEDSEYWLLSLPAKIVAPAFGDSSTLIGRKIGYDRPEMRLLSAYLATLGGMPNLRDASTRALIGRQLVDLIAAAAGAVEEQTTGRGVRGTRYRLAVEAIRGRLADPMLNAERVAQSLGMSERYVQKLFEENGSTVSAFIMAERLKAARNLLVSGARDARTITQIAYDIGFSDAGHFARSFRRQFGETPSMARGQRQ